MEAKINRSLFLRSLRCQLYAWNTVHRNEIFPTDKEFFWQYSSIQIPAITKLSRKLFPEGNDCKRALLSLPLEPGIYYSPSFTFQSLETDIDIVKVIDPATIEIIECKPYSNNKQEIYQEMAYHIYILELLGIKVSKASVLLINPDFYFEEEIIPEKYFVNKEVLGRSKSLIEHTKKKIEELQSILQTTNMPERKEETCCTRPTDCRTVSVCWPELGNANIFSLREAGKLTNILFQKGIRYLKDIPDEVELNRSQKIQKNADSDQKIYFEKIPIREFLEKLKYPLYFLDFETINPALPLYPKTKPFQHIPFLFYLFIKETPDSTPREVFFIEKENGDPRKKILEILSQEMQPDGSIICYNDLVEKRCIVESVAIHPEFSDWKNSILSSFVDISIPFRNFQYYNPLQNGAASLKLVLPALTGLDYKDLSIHNGNTANSEFLKILYRPNWVEDKEKVFSDLVEYCKMDSWAMVKILESLEKLSQEEDFLLEENRR